MKIFNLIGGNPIKLDNKCIRKNKMNYRLNIG